MTVACAAAIGLAVPVSATDKITEKAINENSDSKQEVDQHLFLPLVTGGDDSAGQDSQVEVAATAEDLLANLQLNGGPYVGYDAPAQYLITDAATSGAIYYVDCKNGNDTNSGKSTSAAWKSMEKANAAVLNPGDQMLFKRGCWWVGPLMAGWRGAVGKPILIGAYGTGNLPKIIDSYATNVRISGSYLIFEDLHTTLSAPPNPDPHCLNQPVARKTGFGFSDGAAYNIVRNSVADELSIGISFSDDSHDNQILFNTITDNNVVWSLTPTSADGATGILLHGDRQEIARNYFARNRPICTYTGVLGGISIELFGATNSNIHHNISSGDRVFAELGSSAIEIARNNTFAYNLHVSSYSANSYGARFVVTRGNGSSFGPVTGTKLYNNVVYFTGTGSKAVTCDNCGTDILTMKNNILWASEPFYSNVPFVEANNIFWSSSASPLLHWNGFTMNPASKVTNPQFVDAPHGDFHLKSASPAVNQAAMDTVATNYNQDLDRTNLPVAGITDIGSYEYH